MVYVTGELVGHYNQNLFAMLSAREEGLVSLRGEIESPPEK